ncbi:hypothetical protein GCM10010218_32680 [Streptomyces mashuensis]|uniref:Endonuclease/exonuclease/phosphatase domain-containing protein n=1 Tax=Streptomyces mashuensis TaxID=33904 RepID=A0A919B4T9_9ACTN|nr:endonuclease/exonuclease/phosphatase family protein [Streptomyces mashuensis]GHF48659.1 hypothetical protein GCM10010218_32680 [Streptomyces mashuensis]
MTMRIGTFNCENLFRRPVAYGIEDEAQRQTVLKDFRKLVELLDHTTYTSNDKTEILALLAAHAVGSDASDHTIVLNEPRGGAKLLKKQGGTTTVGAAGRGDWVGWAELVDGDLDWTAVENTARVVAAVNADVLLTVEVENRLTLDRFNSHVLGGLLHEKPYPFNMLIDGNDIRGIDVGVLSRRPIVSIRSHIFDEDKTDGKTIFSRDCPEYEIEFDGGPSLWLLGNHFKSKLGGGDEKRKRQGERVAEIYRAALERSSHVVVAGDMNDTPDSAGVAAVLATGLRDAMSHSSYTGPPGTFGTGAKPENKIDYLMFSPDLWGKVQNVTLEQRGIYAPGVITSFPTVTSRATEASDHCSLYADLDL